MAHKQEVNLSLWPQRELAFPCQKGKRGRLVTNQSLGDGPGRVSALSLSLMSIDALVESWV